MKREPNYSSHAAKVSDRPVSEDSLRLKVLKTIYQSDEYFDQTEYSVNEDWVETTENQKPEALGEISHSH